MNTSDKKRVCQMNVWFQAMTPAPDELKEAFVAGAHH